MTREKGDRNNMREFTTSPRVSFAFSDCVKSVHLHSRDLLLSGSYHVRERSQEDGKRSGIVVGRNLVGTRTGSSGFPFATGVISIFFNLRARGRLEGRRNFVFVPRDASRLRSGPRSYISKLARRANNGEKRDRYRQRAKVKGARGERRWRHSYESAEFERGVSQIKHRCRRRRELLFANRYDRLRSSTTQSGKLVNCSVSSSRRDIDIYFCSKLSARSLTPFHLSLRKAKS